MFISTRIQYVPVGMLNWGARYGWPSTREASKGTEGTKALQIKMNAPFRNPHITLMTLGGIARWKLLVSGRRFVPYSQAFGATEMNQIT